MKFYSFCMAISLLIFFVCCNKPNENSFNQEVINTNACSKVTFSTDSCYWVPNIITPNGDGINDAFGVLNACGQPIQTIELIVSGRNDGTPVFYTDDVNKSWEGAGYAEIYNFTVYVNGATIVGEVTVLPSYENIDYNLNNCDQCQFETQFTASGFDNTIDNREKGLCN